jgi:flagellar hook assembly protein FlgD
MQPSSPNPFKLTTTIRYGLPAETRVRLEVYSPTGQRVATLVDRFEGAGYHSASWDGRDDRGRELVAGVYFCRFEAGTYKTTRKTQLLR